MSTARDDDDDDQNGEEEEEKQQPQDHHDIDEVMIVADGDGEHEIPVSGENYEGETQCQEVGAAGISSGCTDTDANVGSQEEKKRGKHQAPSNRQHDGGLTKELSPPAKSLQPPPTSSWKLGRIQVVDSTNTSSTSTVANKYCDGNSISKSRASNLVSRTFPALFDDTNHASNHSGEETTTGTAKLLHDETETEGTQPQTAAEDGILSDIQALPSEQQSPNDNDNDNNTSTPPSVPGAYPMCGTSWRRRRQSHLSSDSGFAVSELLDDDDNDARHDEESTDLHQIIPFDACLVESGALELEASPEDDEEGDGNNSNIHNHDHRGSGDEGEGETSKALSAIPLPDHYYSGNVGRGESRLSIPPPRSKIIIFGCLFFWCTILIGVVILFIVYDKKNTPPLVTATTTSSSEEGNNSGNNPLPMIIVYYYPPYDDNLKTETLTAIRKDSMSPQYKANKWMMGDPNLDTYPLWRKHQRFSMVTKFYALQGHNWYNNEDWLSYEVSECDWWSRSSDHPCNDQGEFEIENLSANNLNGTLIEEATLDTIQYVDFSNNHLEGIIPPTTATNKVEVFIVSNNSFSGPLVGYAGFKAPNLRIIKVDGNQLESGSVGTIVSVFPKLEILNFTNNRYTGNLPGGDGGGGGGVGSLLRQQKYLTYLGLGDNYFTGTIPSDMALLYPSLQTLDISGNQKVSGTIPYQLGSLPNLTFLDVTGTSVTGQVPQELCGEGGGDEAEGRSEENDKDFFVLAANCSQIRCCT